jgi:3(or 17)beta-hydroxysteroid dehydrogenase
MSRLNGKTVIVTGAAGGMGAADARLLAEHGAAVVVADIQEEAGAKVVAEIREAGGIAEFARLDVRDAVAWEQTVESALKLTGKVDVLVNNAGLSSHSFDTTKPDPLDLNVWNTILGVNLTGAFNGCRAVIPQMTAQGGGSIVNIASVAAIVGVVTGIPAYAASKGGMRAMSKTLAVRYGPAGIRVNTIHPGVLPSMKSAPGRENVAMNGIPLRRVGQTDEIAKAVLFLASAESSYITGVDLVVDGGAISQFSVQGTAATPTD